MALNKNLKTDLCFLSNGYTLNRNLNSTGFCLESDLMQNDNREELAELFLINSTIDETDIHTVYHCNKYLQSPFSEITALSSRHVFSGLTTVPLEKNESLDLSLDEVIKRRRSSRKYTGDYIPKSYVATLLRGSCGITHTDHRGYFKREQRVCASGGGLYPVLIYMLVNKVRHLERGIYLFDPHKDQLFEIEKNAALINSFLDRQSINPIPNFKDACFILFFTTIFWRSIAKYNSAGIRFALIELGEIAQSAHLIASALGVGSCDYASFKTKEVNQILNIDGDFQNFQHAILFGIRSGE